MTVTQSLLLTKDGPGPAPRFTESAMATGGEASAKAALDWLAERRDAHRFDSVRIPFDEMDDWFFAEDTGNLVHRTGRFFTIEGLRVRTDYGPVPEWDQPIIHQPEIGVLGFIVKEIDGVLHCLMQAKMEPGNINLIQLSPTVQATRSNFTRAHQGSKTRYLEYFAEPGRARVLVDVLQSEHGAWFFAKRNRNIVVEVTEDIPPHDDFRWMTIGEIQRLLRVDNIVNMDSRSVLSCVPFARQDEGALHSMGSVLSWFTACAARYELRAERIPLARVAGWRRGPMAISRTDGRDFAVVGVRVRAENREVAGWTQPLVVPAGRALAAFLFKRIGGVPHVLVHARPEAGHMHGVELAPTVECVPDDYRGRPAWHLPRFLDYVERAPAGRVRFDAVQSEEGGRFYHAEGRYMIVEVEDDFPVVEPVDSDYRWLSVHQLTRLLTHPHYVNVQARTLVACLAGLW